MYESIDSMSNLQGQKKDFVQNRHEGDSELKEKIREDLKTSMKARDQRRTDVIRGVISEVKRAEIDSQKELSDEQVIQIVRKEIKKRRDAIEFAQKASRLELVAQNEEEIKILEPYLGDQVSEVQLKELIQAAISNGADNIGKIMGVLNKDH